MHDCFDRLTTGLAENGRTVGSFDKGIYAYLEDGTRIQFREISSEESGGLPTVDIKYADGTEAKVRITYGK